MRCNYTGTFTPITALDTLDTLYVGGVGFPIGVRFDDSVSMQAALDAIAADIVSGGGQIDAVTYEQSGSDYIVTFVQSSQYVDGAEWTYDGNPDGNNPYFVSSVCTSCDYVNIDFTLVSQNFWGFCKRYTCVESLNLAPNDDVGILAALNAFYPDATSIEYTYSEIIPTVFQCSIRILGYAADEYPTYFSFWDGFDLGTVDSYAFEETNCVSQVQAEVDCEGIDCADKDYGLETLIKKTLLDAGNDCDQYAVSVKTVLPGASAIIKCAGYAIDYGIETLLRNLLKVTGDCFRFRAISIAADTPYYRCDEREEDIESLFRRALYEDENGCMAINLAIDTFLIEGNNLCDSKPVCADDPELLETMLRKLFVTDGTNVAIAATLVDRINCGDGTEITCAKKEIGLETAIRSAIIKSSTADVYLLLIYDVT